MGENDLVVLVIGCTQFNAMKSEFPNFISQGRIIGWGSRSKIFLLMNRMLHHFSIGDNFVMVICYRNNDTKSHAGH